MRSFLLKKKKPIVKWGMIPDGVMFQGKVPEGYNLAISPHDPYIILDVDMHGDISGFDSIPENINFQLAQTLKYGTKNDGFHYWLKYTGDKKLMNKASGLGIDLRTSKGYVVWYPKENIEDMVQYISETSPLLNEWLEKLFCAGKMLKI
jgi:hypothetical protein